MAPSGLLQYPMKQRPLLFIALFFVVGFGAAYYFHVYPGSPAKYAICALDCKDAGDERPLRG